LHSLPIPSSLESSVKRVLASKPDDLFVVLNNGLTVLIRRHTGNDVVSSQVSVRTGSLYEGQFLNAGLSHYLEHIVSGGTTRSFTEAEARDRLQRLGGVSNAYTSYNRTVYYINTSSNQWKDALELLLSYVSECTFNPEEVKREKSVIQQEFKLGENNPRRELWKLFTKTAYQVHPVRRPIIGYEEVFVRQDRDALLKYYSDRYQPQNMVMVVVGNVEPFEVLRFVSEKTESFIRRTEEPTALPEEPPQLSSRWAEKELSLARLTQAMIGFPSVKLTHEDLYALDVLAILMGEGRTSRLYRRLKDQENKVLSVSASSWTPDFVRGQFTISLSLTPQNWPGVLENIREEIDIFKKYPVSPKELEKAKKKVIAQHVFGNESASSMASSLASSYLATGDPYFDEAYVEGILGVAAEDIQEVARRYLDTNRMNVAVIKPKSDKESDSSRSVDSKGAKKEPETTQVTYHQLANGLKILLKQDDTLPLVTIQLYGLGGLLLEKASEPGISAFTASLLTAGTKKRTKLEIAQAIESVGGRISSGSANNTYNVSLKVLKEDLDLALDILADIVLGAQFPEEEVEKKRQETLLALQRQDENWQREILQIFKENYFQDNSYGHNALGTNDSVKSFIREDIVKFYQKMVRPGHSVLAIYGDMDPRSVEEKIQEKLGNWKGDGISVPKSSEKNLLLETNRKVEKKTDKTSAGLFFGTNGLTLEDKERPVLDVLDALLSGISYPSGRLHEALRGDADLVYVVHAFPFYGVGTGYFGVITQTTMGNVDKVEKIIMEHLKRLGEEPIPPEELKSAIDMTITMHSLSLETLGAQAQSSAVNEVLGLGWDYDQRYPQLIGSVQAEAIKRLAHKLFAHTLLVRTLPEKPVEVLIAPEQKRRMHVDM
jgi:zinc protease